MKEDRLSVLTPEAVEFDFELADLGSRFIAIFLDTIIQIVILLPVIGLIYLIQFLGIDTKINPDPFSSWIIGLLFLFLFIMGFSGYYIIFELIWNGRTPGKRIVRIKVIKDGGYPLDITSSFIRNLIRLVDFLPFYYFLGIISILISKNKKRLGDIVAGSVVIKEYPDIPPPILGKEEHYEHGESLHLFDLEKISSPEYILIREFLLRRDEMELFSQRNLAIKIAIPLMEKLAIDKIYFEGREIEFLEELARQLRSNEKFL
ncbi:MAG TPA: RDD family protein [Candidatus Eremiobacteraeota bacterium]|nr:MAG: RDD family protein [bacterium ADurb.Bin363]HPZ10362.1 RDD family protein [Candidatus Eremiobacteraeota bacterium]